MWHDVYNALLLLPNWLGVDATRQAVFWSGHFWYRQCFHVLGGVLIGRAARQAGRIGHHISSVVLLLFLVGLGWHEWTDATHGQHLERTIIDLCAWLLGYWVVTRTYNPLPWFARTLRLG